MAGTWGEGVHVFLVVPVCVWCVCGVPVCMVNTWGGTSWHKGNKIVAGWNGVFGVFPRIF